MMSRLKTIACVASLATGLAAGAQADTIRIAYETSDTHLKARTVQVFADKLTEFSGCAVTVATFSNATIYPVRQEVNAATSA